LLHTPQHQVLHAPHRCHVAPARHGAASRMARSALACMATERAVRLVTTTW
jgi:hypothetical protein